MLDGLLPLQLLFTRPDYLRHYAVDSNHIVEYLCGIGILHCQVYVAVSPVDISGSEQQRGKLIQRLIITYRSHDIVDRAGRYMPYCPDGVAPLEAHLPKEVISYGLIVRGVRQFVTVGHKHIGRAVKVATKPSQVAFVVYPSRGCRVKHRAHTPVPLQRTAPPNPVIHSHEIIPHGFHHRKHRVGQHLL